MRYVCTSIAQRLRGVWTVATTNSSIEEMESRGTGGVAAGERALYVYVTRSGRESKAAGKYQYREDERGADLRCARDKMQGSEYG